MTKLIKADILVGVNMEDGYVAMHIWDAEKKSTRVRIDSKTARAVANSLIAQADALDADQEEVGDGTQID